MTIMKTIKFDYIHKAQSIHLATLEKVFYYPSYLGEFRVLYLTRFLS